MKKSFRTILILFLLVLYRYAHAQDYAFLNFKSEDGLAQNYVYSIIQDIQGYLWIGTSNGVSRYNGFKFENYTTKDSLANNYVTCSIRDGAGLWFGHSNGQLTFYDGKKFHPVIYHERKLNSITHFAKRPDGQIWMSSQSNGLFRLDNNKIVFASQIFNNEQTIYSFDFINSNELLIGTGSGLKYCKLKETHEIESIRPVIEIPESKVTTIQKIKKESGFYIATDNDGIFKLICDNSSLKVSKIITDPVFDFTGINDIYEDSQSNVWLASIGNGLFKLHSTPEGKMQMNTFNKANGFPADNVKTVYEDREGIIWSGNFNEGLTRITPKSFSLSTFDKSLYGNNIFSICLSQQNLWIGTEIGLVKMNQLTGRVLSFYGKRAGLPKDTVTAIYSSDGKELWIGTDKNGLFRMNTGNDRILKYSVEGGILENSITTITGKGNQVWVGTKKGLYNINSGTKKMIWYTIAQGLPHNYINSLFLDKDERLWITTNSNTLTYIQDGKVTKMPLSTSAGILTLAPVTEDRESRIWVGSKGNGIFLVESDSVVNFTTKEGLLSNYCYSLFCDNQNYIWIGHKDGLSRISTTDFSVKPIQHIEDISGDFQFNPNAISKDQSENILFGSDKGLISYNPSKELPQLEAPVLVITSIRINGIEKEYANNKIILSPGNYKLRIDFLGVSLKEPTLVTYQYKLEGSDQWSEITKNTSFTNDHLTDGEYAFILKASSGDGVVTDNPLAISIIVKKPIWKKLWFYAVDIIILTLLIFFYVKWRFNRLIAEKRILEEKVIVRTQEIQSQKNEIELQRDMIEDKNANITSSIRYARHIQKAVLPPWEMINKLLPENFVLNKPKDIVSGDFYWLTEKDNKIIFTVADCTGHGVPGAFMSLLGITLLNEIVNIHGITRSDAIVTELRQRLIQSLQQNRKDVTTPDGMDIALCVLDQQNNKLQFTGGMNDLVYIHDGKIEIIRADLVDVSASYINYGQFTVKEINYKKGDLVYLFSDGYQDQFGGDYDRKFLRPHFYNALFEVSPLPLKTQREFLEKKLNKWMKNTVQTDDITVMGVRL